MTESERTLEAARALRRVGRPCAVATTLALVGERWSLLVVRELFYGNHRFDQLARNTGAPRDILTARLRKLEEAGVVRRTLYHEHPPRYEYALTPAGVALEPVITALRQWGDAYATDEPPVSVLHSCGHELGAVWVCRSCGEQVRPQDLELVVHSPGWDTAGPVAQSG